MCFFKERKKQTVFVKPVQWVQYSLGYSDVTKLFPIKKKLGKNLEKGEFSKQSCKTEYYINFKRIKFQKSINKVYRQYNIECLMTKKKLRDRAKKLKLF